MARRSARGNGPLPGRQHKMTHETIQPEGWAPTKGYANGMLTADGTLIPGYVPPEQLRERLDKMAAVSTTTE